MFLGVLLVRGWVSTATVPAVAPPRMGEEEEIDAFCDTCLLKWERDSRVAELPTENNAGIRGIVRMKKGLEGTQSRVLPPLRVDCPGA